jgi:hypothetical protein
MHGTATVTVALSANCITRDQGIPDGLTNGGARVRFSPTPARSSPDRFLRGGLHPFGMISIGGVPVDNVASISECAYPIPGTRDELRAFSEVQRGLAPMFGRVFPDPRAPRTVVVVPSMSLDQAELAKLTGASHYEERFLCLLLLLQLPATRIVYLTSQPVDAAVVDYYLGLVPGVDPADARARLMLITCHDASPAPLTEKLLARPELLARIRSVVPDRDTAHLTCFTATALERTLAVRLGLPLYGCDPALGFLGTKSGSRDVFHQAGVLCPPGFEHLRDEDDMIHALAHLKRLHPWVRRAVIKVEEGFSGEGNAIFSYDGAPDGAALGPWVRATLPSRVRFVAAGQNWETYRAEFARMGGIVEAFVEGDDVRSPSAQCRIDPFGTVQLISTHDQVLGGDTGQIYLGCTFPAESSCCAGIHNAARRVAAVLADDGVVARFGIDFVSVRVPDGWKHYAIEINLRKGGTTHPYLALQLLTNGAYDPATGVYRSGGGRPCFYVASDNLCDAAFHRLSPRRVLSAARREGLMFDHETESGVVFHMLGALPEFGKCGAVCIAPTRGGAQWLFGETVALLHRESEKCGT